MDDEKSTPQGPVDPHGQGGIDAPAPPGGPQRTDAPTGGSVAPEDIHDRPDTRTFSFNHTATPEKEAQLENAGTSLDEPSDGSGNE